MGATSDVAAVRHYTEAARAGFTPAMYNLGVHLTKGVGCQQSLEEGMYWLKQGADRGDKDALQMYQRLDENRTEAGNLVRKAIGEAADMEEEELQKMGINLNDLKNMDMPIKN